MARQEARLPTSVQRHLVLLERANRVPDHRCSQSPFARAGGSDFRVAKKLLMISLAYPNRDRLQMSYSETLRSLPRSVENIVLIQGFASRCLAHLIARSKKPQIGRSVLEKSGDMKVMRLALVTLLFLPASPDGQAKPDDKDPDEVSNDNPARPLQMPPASTEVKEAMDDFER